jgi:hypothetical protein
MAARGKRDMLVEIGREAYGTCFRKSWHIKMA